MTNTVSGNINPIFSTDRTVHRDLKPANILIADGSAGGPQLVKLADFGVSVLVREDQARSGFGKTISPLVALLTGEAEVSEASQGEPSEEDLPTQDDVNSPRDDAQSTGASAPGEPRHGDDLTEAGMIVGTPMYMAPEISFGSRHAQPPSDVFAFGVIAYELITKELPFKRPPVGAVLRQEKLPVPLGLRTRTSLDPILQTLFERALSMDPAQRPTAAELAEGLREPTLGTT